MNDDGVADGDVLDSAADKRTTGILMAKRIGQFDMAFVLPLTFNNMKVGPAEPGAADAHDNIVRPSGLWVSDFFDSRLLAVSV
jgi:hypothetical protein